MTFANTTGLRRLLSILYSTSQFAWCKRISVIHITEKENRKRWKKNVRTILLCTYMLHGYLLRGSDNHPYLEFNFRRRERRMFGEKIRSSIKMGTLLSPFVSPIPSKTPFSNLVEQLFAIAATRASAAVRFRSSGTSRRFIHCFSVVSGKTKPVLVSIFGGYLEPKQSRIQ